MWKCLLFCTLVAAAHGAGTDTLDTWRCWWSPYTVVNDTGKEVRLLKASIAFQQAIPSGRRLVLRLADGYEAEQAISSLVQGEWPHGFWVPVPAAKAGQAVLELAEGRSVIDTRAIELPRPEGRVASLPFRLDRLNRKLLDRLAARESSARPDQPADVISYLAQHDVVYHHPATSWVEGLPIGNGDAGALVTGTEGREQVFHLDKTDIWLASEAGDALGRSYAGALRLRYKSSGGFFQRLSLGRAEVETRDGDFHSVTRVNAARNRLEVEFTGSVAELDLERDPVILLANASKAARLSGSWHGSAEELVKIREEAALAPRTRVAWGQAGDLAWFVHTMPNLRVAVVVRVFGAKVAWKEGRGRLLSKGGRATVVAAIATSRETDDPLGAAKKLASHPEPELHRSWWRSFWQRSWIDIPDKLEENLWYLGIYNQACVSRSDQAVSFFGLWHPMDHRTWMDAYVADAQIPMMWWSTFASNHLELLYPSHRTFGRIAMELLRHTGGPGLRVPQPFVPEWAGGQRYFKVDGKSKCNTPWYALNFWWDYLYSGDLDFLREVTYPMMRMIADRSLTMMVKEGDGRYHILESHSPEQDDTERDNIADWAMFQALLRAVVGASEVLDVDRDLRAQWRERLEKFFPVPLHQDTLAETVDNPHPYRCHPVVFLGLYPAMTIEPDSPLFAAARRTIPVVTTPLAFRYEDRHAKIPGFLGGVEPNGFGSGILTISAARLGDRELYRRFLYGLIVRFHMKQNGLRALLDTRQSEDICRASLVEASNAHTTATTETLLQSWSDHVRLFPCIESKGVYRFSGLRAMGGFVVSAEARDGRLHWARIKSLNGGELRLIAFGKEYRLRFTKSETRDISEEGEVPDLALKPAPARTTPRRVLIEKTESEVGRLLQYPESHPYGQVVHDEFLYLGIPARYGPPRPLPAFTRLQGLAASAAWQDRQESARLLARLEPSPKTLELLDRLCGDTVTVVAHTAAVSLVHLGSEEALRMARHHAEANRIPGLKREVEKAIQRKALALAKPAAEPQ